MERYKRNIKALSLEENIILNNSKVCVAGCGGLGGYIIEMLGRLGAGTITAIDGDVFEESNLNRQLLMDEASIGKSKALAAKERMSCINSKIKVIAVKEFITQANAEQLLGGHNVVVDALDSISSRFILQNACENLGIPFVHGAIAGWYGQVSTIYPGERTLCKIYADSKTQGLEKELGVPSFMPALISSIEVSETVKILLGKENLLRNKLLFIDLLNHDYDIIELG